MNDKIEQLINEINTFSSNDVNQIEQFRIQYISKKGAITLLFDELKNVAVSDRRDIGQKLNYLKNLCTDKIKTLQAMSVMQSEANNKQDIDLTLPVNFNELGSRHPISIIKNKMIQIFAGIGFTVSEGPEIEDDWHNFSALNFPPEHPARDMQDTFFIQKNPDIALRTHTSSVQVRVMENSKPPIRTISPGRVYRNEAISARAHCLFHQIEGLYINKNVSFADLKQTLYYFAREMYGKNIKTRFRPSFFPFTEPSAEMDISCNICGGTGCNICKHSGWVEILGCGMVDPNVLENCGIDSKIYTGYAFGIGIERSALLKYQIKDLRLFYENDLRFLKKFEKIV